MQVSIYHGSSETFAVGFIQACIASHGGKPGSKMERGENCSRLSPVLQYMRSVSLVLLVSGGELHYLNGLFINWWIVYTPTVTLGYSLGLGVWFDELPDSFVK